MLDSHENKNSITQDAMFYMVTFLVDMFLKSSTENICSTKNSVIIFFTSALRLSTDD